MNKKYKEQLAYLMRKCETFEKQNVDLRFEISKLKSTIEILKFTGVFDENTLRINANSFWFPRVCVEDGKVKSRTIDRVVCRYVKDCEIKTVVLKLSEVLEIPVETEPELINNTNSSAKFKIKNRYFLLDKIQDVIVEIPAPAEKPKTKKGTKCDRK